MKPREKIPEKKPVKTEGNQKEKKQKSEEYVLKKNGMLKILRYVFWAMLGFIFLRGVITVLSPSGESEVEQMIKNFRTSLSEEKELNNESMAFAAGFVKEYLTYVAKGEQEHKERLKSYVSEDIYNQSGIMDYKSSAKAVYVQAYRIEEYSKNQIDVYVRAEVEYSSQVMQENQEAFETVTQLGSMVLKVPLYVEKGFYVVESLPLFVSDSVLLEQYQVRDYSGTALKEEQSKGVQTAVENFLKAYYEQDESVINYYLSEEADKTDFVGVSGRYKFNKLVTLDCYQEAGEDIICLAEYTITDGMNNAVMTQKINLSVTKGGSRYYINAINVRTGNINF